MKKALIIASYGEHLENLDISKLEWDHVICADAGLLIAQRLGITPDTVIGDFDSMDLPKEHNPIVLPTEKDLTDSEAAFNWAINHGFDYITMIGGIGGRFDHTMGNIGIMAKCAKNKISVKLVDGQNRVYMIRPGVYTIRKEDYPYLGIVSYDKVTKGIYLSDVKYPMEDGMLTNDTTFGVSNEILGETCKLTFTQGMLLIIQTRDI